MFVELRLVLIEIEVHSHSHFAVIFAESIPLFALYNHFCNVVVRVLFRKAFAKPFVSEIEYVVLVLTPSLAVWKKRETHLHVVLVPNLELKSAP